MEDHIVMNGISIWHDSLESKTNPVTYLYFLRRNTLILYPVYGKKNGIYAGISHLLRMLHCIKEKKSNEYLYTRRAVNDFLKGPEFIAGTEQAEIFEMAGNPNETVLPAKSTKTEKSGKYSKRRHLQNCYPFFQKASYWQRNGMIWPDDTTSPLNICPLRITGIKSFKLPYFTASNLYRMG